MANLTILLQDGQHLVGRALHVVLNALTFGGEVGVVPDEVERDATGEAVYVSAWDAQALRDDLDAAFSGAGLAMDIPPIVKPRL